MKKIWKLKICLILLFSLPLAVNATVLFQENWNSGSIDTAKWTPYTNANPDQGSGGVLDLVEVSPGSGDYALRMGDNVLNFDDWAFAWDVSIWSKATFPRGENIRCTFTVWHNYGESATGPPATGFYGPWHSQADTQIWRFMEACVDHVWSEQRWAEGGQAYRPSDQAGPLIDTGLATAFRNAGSKDQTLTLRVWLGDASGARMDYSTDGGQNWLIARISDGGISQPLDTRGQNAGMNHQNIRIGNHNPNHIAFGWGGMLNAPQYDSTKFPRPAYLYLDDITVESGGNGPPTPTPVPTPIVTPSVNDVITSPMLQLQGQWYEAVVPDTLDLAERARLAVHGLTSFLNRRDNYSPFIQAFFRYNPAYMFGPGGGNMYGPHNWGKIAESLLKARLMCGSTENMDIEEQSLKGMLSLRRIDSFPVTMEYPCMSRIMLALMTLDQQSSTPALRQVIQAYAQTHINAAADSGDKAWYYDGPPAGVFGFWQQAFIHGTALRVLSCWNHLSGDAGSLELGRKFKNFILQPRFWNPKAEPKAVVSFDRAHFYGHHHSYTTALMGLLWYAKATHDVRLMEFVRCGYEYLRNWGIARIGLFGENCTVGDMTQLAIRLSDFGVGDYWEDVDGYVRNHLTELQITDPVKLHAVVDSMPPPDDTPDPNNTTTDQVIERNVGAYLSDGSHPTLIPRGSFQWTICCSGNCTPALYLAWHGITRYDESNKVATVNLLLNRASAWLDVDSHLPYEGKVVIQNKTARVIQVRIPCWVDKKAVQAWVGGQAVSLHWHDQYLWLDELFSGDEITITFPMVTTTETYTITWTDNEFWFEGMNEGSGRDTYTLTLKGNTLVDITPRSTAQGYPLYQRNRERDGDRATTHTVTRFISNVLPGI